MKFSSSKILFLLVLIISTISCFYLLLPKYKIAELNNSQTVPWGIETINAQVAWSKGWTGEGVKIAVMDSGINFSHPDISVKLHSGFNFINPSQPPIDDYGHGSLVTGIIAAANNGLGIVGIAPDAEIYPLKVLDQQGYGDILHIVEAIEWCIINEIDIINMSFALEFNNPLLKETIQRALNSNIIVVASAMNSYGNDAGYPASYDGVISVTSLDKKLRIGETSSRGKIDFSAPGVNILSTTKDNWYEYYSGTSMAAPHITGIIALLLQDNKIAVKDIIKELIRYIDKLGDNTIFGEGIVNLIK